MKNDAKYLLEKINEIILKYLEQNENPDTPVVDYHSAKDLISKVDLSLPERKLSLDHVISKIEQYLKYSVRTSHPLFNNQLNGGFNPVGLVADIVTHLTNTSMATYEIAPMATLIELKLVDQLLRLIGHDTGEGIMVTGGSNANMMAIHCARSHFSPEVREKGNAHQFVVFVSDQAHYSFKKAVIVLGIGTDNLVAVPSCKDGKLHPENLEQAILKAKAEGKTPLMVASTAGTTVKGDFDPITEIDAIAKKYHLWHHVDGAWGAPCLFSPKLKHKLAGAELADSFTWDAHKLMGTGLITSYFLTKHQGTLNQANSGGGKKYLFHENENGEYDIGLQSLQCGRKVDCLKLWFTWNYLGNEGFRQLVEGQREKALYFYEKIKNDSRFKVLHEPEYLNICFQVVPKDSSIDINQFNLDIRYKILKSGKMMINFSSDDDLIYFRMVFANNILSKTDIDSIVEVLAGYI